MNSPTAQRNPIHLFSRSMYIVLKSKGSIVKLTLDPLNTLVFVFVEPLSFSCSSSSASCCSVASVVPCSDWKSSTSSNTLGWVFPATALIFESHPCTWLFVLGLSLPQWIQDWIGNDPFNQLSWKYVHRSSMLATCDGAAALIDVQTMCTNLEGHRAKASILDTNLDLSDTLAAAQVFGPSAKLSESNEKSSLCLWLMDRLVALLE